MLSTRHPPWCDLCSLSSAEAEGLHGEAGPQVLLGRYTTHVHKQYRHSPQSQLYLDVKRRGAGSISVVERPDRIEGGSVHNSEGNSQEKGDVNLE